MHNNLAIKKSIGYRTVIIAWRWGLDGIMWDILTEELWLSTVDPDKLIRIYEPNSILMGWLIIRINVWVILVFIKSYY